MPDDTPYDKIKHAIGEFVADITTVDVVTLTGNITLDVGVFAEAGADDTVRRAIDFTKLHNSMIASAKTGDVRIAGFTHIDLDKDTVQFAANAASGVDPETVAHHRTTVEGVLEARKAFLEAILSTAGNLKLA